MINSKQEKYSPLCLSVSLLSVSLLYTTHTHPSRVHSLSCSDGPDPDRLPPTLLRLRHDPNTLHTSTPLTCCRGPGWLEEWVDGDKRKRLLVYTVYCVCVCVCMGKHRDSTTDKEEEEKYKVKPSPPISTLPPITPNIPSIHNCAFQHLQC